MNIREVEQMGFFNKTKCDRCSGQLTARIMSWFNEDTICLECSSKEDVIKQKLRENGKKPSDYEGCGFIPKV